MKWKSYGCNVLFLCQIQKNHLLLDVFCSILYRRAMITICVMTMDMKTMTRKMKSGKTKVKFPFKESMLRAKRIKPETRREITITEFILFSKYFLFALIIINYIFSINIKILITHYIHK